MPYVYTWHLSTTISNPSWKVEYGQMPNITVDFDCQGWDTAQYQRYNYTVTVSLYITPLDIEIQQTLYCTYLYTDIQMYRYTDIQIQYGIQAHNFVWGETTLGGTGRYSTNGTVLQAPKLQEMVSLVFTVFIFPFFLHYSWLLGA